MIYRLTATLVSDSSERTMTMTLRGPNTLQADGPPYLSVTYVCIVRGRIAPHMIVSIPAR